MVKAAFLVEKAEECGAGNAEVGRSPRTRAGSVVVNRCFAEHRSRMWRFDSVRVQYLTERIQGNLGEDCDMGV